MFKPYLTENIQNSAVKMWVNLDIICKRMCFAHNMLNLTYISKISLLQWSPIMQRATLYFAFAMFFQNSELANELLLDK